MDSEHPEASATLTPDQEVEAARAALAAGEIAGAAAHLARALARDVGRREWLIFLDEIVQAGGLDPDTIAPLGERPYFATVAVRAYVLARRRDLTAAIQLLLRVFTAEPSVPFVQWGASWLSAPGAAAKIDVDEVVYSLIQLLQRFPGDDLDDEDREALAETMPLVEALEEAHPTSWRLAGAQSMILRKIGRYEEASSAAEKAYAAEPVSSTAVTLAYARREEGDFPAARAAFEAAIRLDPESLEIPADLAQLLCNQGLIDEGIALFDAIVEKDPRHHCAYPASLYCHALRDGDAQAYTDLAAYAGEHPDDEETASWLASARRAWLHPPTTPEVNEGFTDNVADAIAHLASHDPELDRFGATSHRYELTDPLPEARAAAVEAGCGASIPVDYRAFLTRVAASGAGPYHGLLPLDAPAQLAGLEGTFPHLRPFQPDVEAMSEDERKAFESDATVAGTIALAHLGCQYFSLLVIKGPRAGTVWADIRSAGLGLVPTHDSFTDWYGAWIHAMVHDAPFAIPVPKGRCAPQSALMSYFESWKASRGIEGELSQDEAREAVSGIGAGGIETRAEASRYFDADDPVDVCRICDQMFRYFAEHCGMHREQILPGIPPKAAREQDNAP
ncbi:MAG: tetratricopeptide repeat protein [Byssovorax sp.]